MSEELHEGHRQRLKNRYLSEGLDNFEEHEILQLLLFYSIPRKDTNDIAHLLINKFGSLSKVMEANPVDLQKISGISEHSAVLISMMPQLFKRYKTDRDSKKLCLATSQKVGEFLTELYLGKSYEAFCVLALDAQYNLIHCDTVHEGTIDETRIYPRLIVESALRHKASYVILSHNHPAQTLYPSASDIEATDKIKVALNAIDINVLDHIIVSGNKYISFREKGLL